MQMVWWVAAEGTHIMERTALQASRPGRGAAELSIWNEAHMWAESQA